MSKFRLDFLTKTLVKKIRMSVFPTNSTEFHQMPVVTRISPGVTALPPSVSRVTNLGHNQLNRISRKFH